MNQLEEKDNQYLPKTYINNSKKVNVQLSLLYRFVQAYKNNPLDVYDINSIIVEEHEVSLTYNDSMERKLENWIMMDYWNENFQDAKDYYYIAITNDSKEVIDEKMQIVDYFHIIILAQCLLLAVKDGKKIRGNLE